MPRYTVVLVALLALVAGCSAKKVTNPSAPSGSTSVRQYSSTASVGDFLTVAVDPGAHTISYVNRSNGDTGVVPYTLNPDGTFTVADTTGNIVGAYEVPNFVIELQMTKAGPTHDAHALVTGVQSCPVTQSSFANRHMNYMQFRTSQGGMEAGACSVDGAGNVTTTSYWPAGSVCASDSFHTNVGLMNLVIDPSGSFFRCVAGPNDTDYVFFTPSGMFAVDTPNGAILGFNQASSPAFDPSVAGAYKTIFFHRPNALMAPGGGETGNSNLGSGTITVGTDGSFTLVNKNNITLASGTLIPVSSAPWLYGSTGQIMDPCNGMFTMRLTTDTTRQDVFVSFLNGAALFSSFKATIPSTFSSTYDYWYGVALK